MLYPDPTCSDMTMRLLPDTRPSASERLRVHRPPQDWNSGRGTVAAASRCPYLWKNLHTRTFMRDRLSVAVLVVAVLAAGCSKTEPPQDTKTRAQKDSAIGRSGLPGSKGVMDALGAADSARARAARTDSASRP